MNLYPVGVGAALTIGAAGGLVAGALSERASHDKLAEQKEAWKSYSKDFTAAFADEKQADRTRGFNLNTQIDRYELEHPKPEGLKDLELHRSGNRWTIDEPDRSNWMNISATGALGTAILGGIGLAIKQEGGPKVFGLLGATLLAGSIAYGAGAIGSNVTH